MESIIMRALEYEVKRRWSSADEMLAALEAGQARLQANGTSPAALIAPPAPALAPPPGYPLPPGYPAPPPGYPGPYGYPPAGYGYPPRPPRPPRRISQPLAESTTTALWSFKAEDEIRSSALVAKGIVFIGSYDSNIYALNSKSGDFLWKPATEAGVRLHAGLVGRYPHLRLRGPHHLRPGGAAWRSDLVDPYRGAGALSPRVFSGQVYIGSDDQHLYCVDARTGRVYWKYRAWGSIRSTPAVGKNLVFVGSDDGNLYAIESTTGTLKWKFHSNAPDHQLARLRRRPGIYRLERQPSLRRRCGYRLGGLEVPHRALCHLLARAGRGEGLCRLVRRLSVHGGCPIGARGVEVQDRRSGGLVSPIRNGYLYFGSADTFVFTVLTPRTASCAGGSAPAGQ